MPSPEHSHQDPNRPQFHLQKRGPETAAMDAAMNSMFPVPKESDWDLTITPQERAEVAALKAEAEQLRRERATEDARQAVHESFTTSESQPTQPDNPANTEDIPQKPYKLPEGTVTTGGLEGNTMNYFAKGASVGEVPQEVTKTQGNEQEHPPAPQPSAKQEDLSELAAKLSERGYQVNIHPGGNYRQIGNNYRFHRR